MPKKRRKQDIKIGELKRNRVQGIPIIRRGVPQHGITKKEFMEVLAKAVKPNSQCEIEDKEAHDKRNQKETNE